MGKFFDYLELVRIPAVFTAQADILAGFLIAGRFTADTRPPFLLLVLLLAASSFFYMAGMVLNDFFDFAVDCRERPRRPLPSGRIRKESALFLGIILVAAGILTTAQVNRASLITGLILAGLIILYNSCLKQRLWLGPVTMGGCRYFNFLLGFCLVPLAVRHLLLPFLTGIFIFGVSVLSRLETKGGMPGFTILISSASIAATFLLYWVYHLTNILPHNTGLILCLIWSVLSLGYVLRLLDKKTPADFQKTVQFLLLGLVLLNGIIAAGACPVYYSFIVWALVVPPLIISKKFYIT